MKYCRLQNIAEDLKTAVNDFYGRNNDELILSLEELEALKEILENVEDLREVYEYITSESRRD